MNYTITKNDQFNSLEIKFEGKPSEAIRNELKALRFRWHQVKQVWYGFAKENALKAILNRTTKTSRRKKEKPVKSEIKGLKVGDILISSWGYEQTNVDAFQVVALVGSSSVRVKEVVLPVRKTENDGYCSMSEDLILYKPDHFLKPVNRPTFIKDNEKGDLKRIQENGTEPFIKIDSFANAYKLKDGEKYYHSWYY